MTTAIRTERLQLDDGEPIVSLAADPIAGQILYLHGVPNASELWIPFLERTGGIAVDLPGFGESTKRGDREFTIAEYDGFLEWFLDRAGIEETALVMHDWGAVGLALAQRMPERITRVVLIDAVPFLPGYRWHRIARAWRAPGVGEMAMGLTIKPMLRLISREGNVKPGPLPDDFIDSVYSHFDQGTQRAILRLYRSSGPDVLEAAGARLGEITAPALVVWGDHDPYLPPRFADAYGERLPNARVRHVADAGHWPWLDVPELVGEIADFVTASD